MLLSDEIYNFFGCEWCRLKVLLSLDIIQSCANLDDDLQFLNIIMDVLLNGLSKSAKGKLQSLCCMMGKTMSLRCHFLAVNG